MEYQVVSIWKNIMTIEDIFCVTDDMKKAIFKARELTEKHKSEKEPDKFTVEVREYNKAGNYSLIGFMED